MKGATVEEPLMRLASLLARGDARRRRGEDIGCVPPDRFLSPSLRKCSEALFIFLLFCSINERLKRGKNKQTNRSTIYFPILTVKFKTALYILGARVIYLCKHANK